VLPEPTTTLALPDGRRLACDDVGDPAGRAVVWLHGAPDCRLARHPDDGLAAAAGVRLLALDRPGYGWSDPPAPTPLTFGDELGLLLDELGVGTCVVAAWSAGAPWAFGAAAALGERVERVVTYGAVAPLEAMRDDASVAEASGPRAPLVGEAPDELADELAMLLVPTAPVPYQQAWDQVVESVSPEMIEDRELVDALAWSLVGAVDRYADAGLRSDVVVQYSPGVPELLAAVRCPVVLVHGERDPIAGPAVGEWFAGALAHATVEVWAGAAHQGVLLEWERFLALTGAR